MRSQTSTEYLIITAVVIIIAVIVIGVLGGVPGIGGGSSDDVADFALQNEQIGVVNYATSNSNTSFIVRNNAPEVATVNQIWVNQKPCAENVLPKQLAVGEEISVVCHNIRSLASSPRVNIQWTSSQTNSQIVTGPNRASYKGTTTTDCWSDTPDLNGEQPICTCNDLNLTRFNLTGNFVLENNIDFLDSHCTVYRQGGGFIPISGNGGSDQFAGNFNGQGYVIANLYINRANNEVALFGDAETFDGANTSNLGLVDVDITGQDNTAGLVGSGGRYELRIEEVYVTGTITGADKVAPLVGSGNLGSAGPNITGSFALGTVTGTSDVGGLIGYFGDIDNLVDSYSEIKVYGSSNVGGLVAGWIGGYVTGFNNVSWKNYTDDNAVACVAVGAGANVSGCSP